MEYFKLEEVATFVNGYAFSSEKYEDKGIPIIRISDIDEEIKLEDCICYPEKSLEKLKEYTVKKGSLLIALSGATTGKMGVFNSDRIAYLNQRICSIFSKDKNLLQEYLIFYLKNLKEIILKNSYGGAQPNISSKWLEKRVIGIPSLTEQKEIVVILDKLVTIINKKKNQINLLEELVKSRFIEMFGDFENSTQIGDVCTIKARIGWQGLSKKEYLLSGEYRLITGVDFNNGRINFENCYYVNKERYEQDDNIKIKMGDVLVTKDGTIGKVAIVDKLDIPATLNSGVFVLRNKDSTLNNVFLVYSLLSEDFKRFIENIKIGATVPHLNQSSFVKHKIKLPPLYLQEEFSQFVEKTDKLKFEAEKSLKEMENLYESLMQKFFKQN